MFLRASNVANFFAPPYPPYADLLEVGPVADGSGWSVRVDYSTTYFTADDAMAMLRQWQAAVSLITDNPDLPVRTLLGRLAEIG